MYTRSCAVNSIVGHILGIGDRHCNNILVHQKTGEIVHIDFGIVFEQGKVSNPLVFIFAMSCVLKIVVIVLTNSFSIPIPSPPSLENSV